jgi:transcriptional regulator with XRE-family HTH domain
MRVIQYNSRRAKPWQIAAREKMVELRITQVEMAEKLGVTQGCIGHWLNDTRKPNIDQINAILKECHIPQFLVYPVVDLEVEVAQRLPLISWSSIPKPGQRVRLHSIQESIISPFQASDASFCLQSAGDGTYREKEILLVDPNADPAPGDDVIVEGHGLCRFDGGFMETDKGAKVPLAHGIIGVIVGTWMKRR